MRQSVLLLVALSIAAPSLAQSVLPTHGDAAGAVSGRSPHKLLRENAPRSSCGAGIHIPAGKPHTYGTYEGDRPCRSPSTLTEVARQI